MQSEQWYTRAPTCCKNVPNKNTENFWKHYIPKRLHNFKNRSRPFLNNNSFHSDKPNFSQTKNSSHNNFTGVICQFCGFPEHVKYRECQMFQAQYMPRMNFTIPLPAFQPPPPVSQIADTTARQPLHSESTSKSLNPNAPHFFHPNQM